MDFVKADIRANRKSIRGRSQTEVDETIEKIILLAEETFGDVQLSDVESVCTNITGSSDDSNDEKFKKYIAADLLLFARFKKNPELVFPPTVYWFSGDEALERMPDWLFSMMKTGFFYNLHLIIRKSPDISE